MSSVKVKTLVMMLFFQIILTIGVVESTNNTFTVNFNQFELSFRYSHIVFLIYQPILENKVNPNSQLVLSSIKNLTNKLQYLTACQSTSLNKSKYQINSALRKIKFHQQILTQKQQLRNFLQTFQNIPHFKSSILLWAQYFNIVAVLQWFPNISTAHFDEINYSLNYILKIIKQNNIQRTQMMVIHVRQIKNIIDKIKIQQKKDLVEPVINIKEIIKKMESILSLIVEVPENIFKNIKKLSLKQFLEMQNHELREQNIKMLNCKWNKERNNCLGSGKKHVSRQVKDYIEIGYHILNNLQSINHIGIKSVITNLRII